MLSVDDICIRFAEAADVPLILSLIKELAEYERLAHEVTAVEADIERWLFSAERKVEALIAEYRGAAAGFAVFFHNFSTFLGRPGIYLEDLFVRPASRGVGLGQALLRRLAQIALERECGRLEWAVLDWNQPAIGFYQRLGAKPMNEWTTFQLAGDSLRRLAADDM